MNKRELTKEDIKNILKENGIENFNLKPFPKSGQKAVFRVDCKPTSVILKVYDITPYDSISLKEFNTHIDYDEFELQKNEEIRVMTLYISREVNASKECTIFPRMIMTDNIEDYILGDYLYKYYFEELIEGKVLDDSEYYKEKNSLKEVATFLNKSLELIKTMWTTAYVHRDIKPSNIILSDGDIKFIDPGLARSINDETITRTGMTLGTPRYWAPEQKEIQSNYNWTFKTDLYPLGLIAIEMYLPEFRKMSVESLKNMELVFKKWREKDNSKESIA
ncbi:protein kinase, partial [Enterococcus mundtii]